MLRERRRVEDVRWPGFGGMVSFRHPDALRSRPATKLFTLAESLGGVESLIEVPQAMTHQSVEGSAAAVPPDLVRLSVGVEAAEDLVEDLRRPSPLKGSGPFSRGGARRYDLVIVGMGSAGMTAAEFASTLPIKVAAVERGRLGGDCLWTGCVPSKALLGLGQGRAPHAQRGRLRHPRPVEPEIDTARVLARIRDGAGRASRPPTARPSASPASWASTC